MGLQQWVIDTYPPALGTMILPGGSISDLFGRVPVMRFGLVAFGVGSVLAATAPVHNPPLPAAAAKRPTRETSLSRAVSFTRVIGAAG